MATYTVRVAQTNYYDVTVKAEGVAEARQKAKEWAVKVDQAKLDQTFFASGPFVAEQTNVQRAKKPAAK